MVVKKNPERSHAAVMVLRPVDLQLRELYARRLAVENLIQSLQQYGQQHPKPSEIRQWKSA